MGTRSQWPRYLHARKQLRIDPGRMCLVRYASKYTSAWRVTVANLVKEYLVVFNGGFWSRTGGIHRVEAVPLSKGTRKKITVYGL